MFFSTKYKDSLVTLVVDEAHCVRTWGDEFRRAFSKIGDLRSILPASINMMALTATASVETSNIVSQQLSMKDPILVTLPPNREDIYQVHPKASLNELTDDLCSEFIAKRTKFPKTVIFIHQYSACSDGDFFPIVHT